MTFAEKLQELRKQKGLSQEELAEICGVSRQSVSKWETDIGYPEVEKLFILSDLFDVTLDELLRDKRAAAVEKSSPYAPYLRKWCMVLLNDKDISVLSWVALLGIGDNYMIYMDVKGKVGILNTAAIASVSEADIRKYKWHAVPDLPPATDTFTPAYLHGQLCNVLLWERKGQGTPPCKIHVGYLDMLRPEAVTLRNEAGQMTTVLSEDILYIAQR